MEYKKEYSENLISIINNFEFTKEEEKVLNESLLKLDGHDAQKVFRDMYIFYLNDMSLSEIANIYDRSTRAIQNIFKKVGLNRDKFEAQRIAAKKRNYTEIRKTFKKTMKERFIENQLFGSKIEEYTRIEFSQILNSILPYDVIVGVNAVMSTGELDIPIIVFNENRVYKFGVEVDGIVFHKNKINKDKVKVNNFRKGGYKVYRLSTKAYCKDEKLIYADELRNKINFICQQIKSDIGVRF
ncbi:hypothetical protein [Clostridium perfringens]|uniref:hypothetical protein n=1 Tax=Clostridium perfringens TaxID=1502 RepID=UPI001C866E88|nr:hypothetical protein [Clostridium perfringens]